MTCHCAPVIDQFDSYCATMRKIYGADVPLMSREQWDNACNEPRKVRVLTEAEFDYGNFSEEMGDGPIY